MLKYINQKEYISLLEAESIPSNFNRLVIEASSYINRNTFGRIDINNIPEQVKYTTCLIVDLLIERNKKLSEIDILKSQNIEGWSESYATPEEIKQDYEENKKSILRDNLYNVIGKDGNYLLYRGD